MIRSGALIFALLLLASAGGASSNAPPSAASSSAADDVRFAALNVYLDPHGTPLAAYQAQVTTNSNDVTLVGIEGGEHPAFAQPPYYDKRAILSRRLIFAAYSTASTLPSSKTRVATLMVRISGKQEPKWNALLMVAGSVEGKSIDASVTVAESSDGK